MTFFRSSFALLRVSPFFVAEQPNVFDNRFAELNQASIIILGYRHPISTTLAWRHVRCRSVFVEFVPVSTDLISRSTSSLVFTIMLVFWLTLPNVNCGWPNDLMSRTQVHLRFRPPPCLLLGSHVPYLPTDEAIQPVVVIGYMSWVNKKWFSVSGDDPHTNLFVCRLEACGSTHTRG